MSKAALELESFSALRFSGADALAFLQGQVSNDTRRLAEGVPLLSAYSSAQGRVVAVLHLVPEPSGVIAILPRELARPTLERLRKFVLRSKVKIEDLSEHYGVAGVPAAGDSDIPSAHEGIAVARVPDAAGTAPRYWVVRARNSGLRSADGGRADLEWRLADIRAGMPRIYAATSEQFVAQMLNLDLLEAISFTKGCYTGQEIIARTQHLGRIKRRMARLALPAGAWSIGQALRLKDGRSGHLIDAAPVGEGFEALAVLNLRDAAAPVESANGTAVAADELPLPYLTDR